MALIVKPVKKYKRPQYPTKLEVQDDPELLRKCTPQNWQQMPELLATLGLFITLQCTPQKSIFETDMSSNTKAIVAPVFIHGSGYAATGCVVVNPPTYLSEEEAIQIVSEMLSSNQVDLTDRNKPIEMIKIIHNKNYYYVDDNRIDVPAQIRPLEVDGYNPEKHIAIEFISRYNDYDFFNPDTSSDDAWSSYMGLDLKETAIELAKRVRDDVKGVYFGTFYDPCSDVDTNDYNSDDDWDMYFDKRAKSISYLKEQVKDFVDWLKAQGVI